MILAAFLRGLDGVTVKDLGGSDVRQEWAGELASWPQELATELDAQGLPASEVLKTALQAAEDNGYEWPVRYEIR